MNSYYGFGQKSAALLGLLLTSDGQITGFACSRPTGTSNDMSVLYRTDPLVLTQAGLVPFTFTLAATQVGLLTVEPRGWPSNYEVNRTHFLGMFNPFGADEIPYQQFGGINRSKSIASNRVFDGVFSFNPKASDPKQRAMLTLTDVESKGQSLETVSISAFDDPVNNIPGGIFVTIRVNDANYADGCATVEFTGGQTLNITTSNTLKPVSKLVLNTTATPFVLAWKPAKKK